MRAARTCWASRRPAGARRAERLDHGLAERAEVDPGAARCSASRGRQRGEAQHGLALMVTAVAIVAGVLGAHGGLP